MLIQDKDKREVIKAKAIGTTFVIAITANSISLYDLRKAAIILKESIFEHTPFPDDLENEINDLCVI